MVIENLLAYIVRRNCETDRNGHWMHLQFSDSVKGLYLSLSLLIAMQMILSLEMQMSLSLGTQLSMSYDYWPVLHLFVNSFQPFWLLVYLGVTLNYPLNHL